MAGTIWSEVSGFILLLSAALLVIAVCTQDWSRLTAETSMWTHVYIDDYWGLWSWATVMTTGTSAARLQFTYDWCGHEDTHKECLAITLTRVFAVACVAFEALAVLCAISIECINPHTGNGIRTAYVSVGFTACHMIMAVLVLIAWSSVQDYLRAQDLTSGGVIDFGFSWYLVLVSGASTLASCICMLNHVWTGAGMYYTISDSPSKRINSVLMR